jgi:hypothetical protein
MKEWTTHCQTCNWTGVRAREEMKPKEEKGNHLKSHPGHKVRVWITGEESLSLPSASLYDKKSYLDSLMKIHA